MASRNFIHAEAKPEKQNRRKKCVQKCGCLVSLSKACNPKTKPNNYRGSPRRPQKKVTCLGNASTSNTHADLNTQKQPNKTCHSPQPDPHLRPQEATCSFKTQLLLSPSLASSTWLPSPRALEVRQLKGVGQFWVHAPTSAFGCFEPHLLTNRSSS